MAALQDTLATALKTSSFFQSMPIITEKLQDIENEIERALGSLGGVCVIILTPRARVTNPNLPGPQFDDASVLVRVVENVIVNQSPTGTRRPASEVAEHVAATLHHQHTPARKIILCRQIALVPDPENVIYDVTFETKFGVTK